MYPHHETHGLALPFGWTNGVPKKPIYCHDTLPATPTNTPFGFSPGWPMPTKGLTATVVAKQKQSQTGTKARKQLGLTRLMSSYLAEVALAHKLPSLEALARGTTIESVSTFP